jgi:hypothetical protein
MPASPQSTVLALPSLAENGSLTSLVKNQVRKSLEQIVAGVSNTDCFNGEGSEELSAALA